MTERQDRGREGDDQSWLRRHGIPDRIMHGPWLARLLIAGALLSMVVSMCRE